MGRMIDVGIDLGTTNSLIAKFSNGEIEVFKNPSGHKETLPSVVGFKSSRILVGDPARTYMEKEPKNVVGNFKRKMGTTESFSIEGLKQNTSPVELSSLVLKELKTFVRAGDAIDAAVITIPASFDMVQANATKEAGRLAGFEHVVLLQEPIAASLAYANKKGVKLGDGRPWIVYDFGGGTFDAALVKTVGEELKVVDHEGDNYLGGSDFDALIVERIIVPQLEAKGQFSGLLSELKSASGKHNRLWYRLLLAAEAAKIELSAKTVTDLEVSIEDDREEEIEATITIARSEFESVIKDLVHNSADMLRKLLTRNSFQPSDVDFVLMVGGSTYIPFVRKRVEELLGIKVNTGIDPTNAIAVGAAYFAGTKPIETAKTEHLVRQTGVITIKTAYNRVTRESEELLSAKVTGEIGDLFYRIVRSDGGFDTGLKPLTSRLSDDLQLVGDAFNEFSLTVYDRENRRIPADVDVIRITHGKYGVAGQMLPEDLCLVKDDVATGDTKLDRVFSRSVVLPAKAKRTVELTRDLVDGSKDVQILVVEGSADNHHAANKPIGRLILSRKGLKRDLPKGTDIELTFMLSESQDLTIQAHVQLSGQEFAQVFNPTFRSVSIDLLSAEVSQLSDQLEREAQGAVAEENYEVAGRLQKLREPLRDLILETMQLAPDDVTDDRYKLEDRKRKIAQDLSQAVSGAIMHRLRDRYAERKNEAVNLIQESGNDSERKQLQRILDSEPVLLASNSPKKLEAAEDQLRFLIFQVLRRTPAFLVSWFEFLVSKRESLNDQMQANILVEAGKKLINSEDFEKLADVNQRLHSLLPDSLSDTAETRRFSLFTGIG